MLRKKDVLVILAVLAVAAAIYGGIWIGRSGQTASGQVDISVDGVHYATVRLDAPGEVRIAQETGEENVIVVADGAVSMAYSSCNNQLCVHQGPVTADNWTRRAMGRSIICLPNRVLVELTLDDGHSSLEDIDAPDI